MQYYEQKRRAFIDVQRIIGENETTNVNLIYGFLYRRYGFSESIANKFLNRLEIEGNIERKGDEIKRIK